MPNVSFYILSSDQFKDYVKVITKLAVKAFEAEHQVLIYSQDAEILKHVDDHLWSFDSERFVPHVWVSSDDEIDESDPVILASFEPAYVRKDLLIQVADQVPDNFAQYQRIIEVMYQAPECLAKGRERFRFYRSQGIEPTTIKL